MLAWASRLAFEAGAVGRACAVCACSRPAGAVRAGTDAVGGCDNPLGDPCRQMTVNPQGTDGGSNDATHILLLIKHLGRFEADIDRVQSHGDARIPGAGAVRAGVCFEAICYIALRRVGGWPNNRRAPSNRTLKGTPQ